jgi:hypothetical protein
MSTFKSACFLGSRVQANSISYVSMCLPPLDALIFWKTSFSINHFPLRCKLAAIEDVQYLTLKIDCHLCHFTYDFQF